MAIENTSERDPLLHFLGILGGGQDTYISNMEKQGQSQVVQSQVLPTEGDWEGAEALGIVRGEKVDDLFTNVTLPEGWARKKTDHDMWSKIVDEHGIPRIAVGYKAAFYDRWASFHVENVGANVAFDISVDIFEGTEPSLPEYWEKLTLQEQEDVLTAAESRVANAASDLALMGGDDTYWREKLLVAEKALAFISEGF